MRLKKYLFLLVVAMLWNCTTNFDKKADLISIDQKWRNGDLLGAKADVEKYLDTKNDNEYAWTLLGHIESDLGEDALAGVAYEKATSINPNTVEAITGLGIISRKNGEYDRASEYYNKAIEIDPNYAEAYSSLVAIYLKRKKFKEAVDAGLKGYNLSKDNDVIAANLAVAYHYYNDTIQRNKFYEIAKKNGYKNIETMKLIFDGELTIFD